MPFENSTEEEMKDIITAMIDRERSIYLNGYSTSTSNTDQGTANHAERRRKMVNTKNI